MASWFRAAEELFEVVDRRAKQVTDDLVAGQNPAADLGVFGRVLVTNPLKGIDSKPLDSSDANSTQTDRILGNESTQGVAEKNYLPFIESVSSDSSGETVNALTVDNIKKYQAEQIGGDDVSTKSAIINNAIRHSVEEIQSTEFKAVECKITAENGSVSVELIAEHSNQEKNVPSDSKDIQPSSEKSRNITSNAAEIQSSHNTQTQKEVLKLEEQLDEAQRLLKSASSTGQSKEARLAKVCAGLSSRLQEYKSENTQLEQLLQNEREENAAKKLKLKELQLELQSVRADVNLVESQMSYALTSKNAEIEALTNSSENFRKQVAVAEGKLAALQAELEAIMRSRDISENGMIQTLKEALDAAENRAEEEHLSHVATRKAAAQREAELEQCVADVTASLSKMQRIVDERTQRATDLEQKMSILEVDCASLTQELLEMEKKLRRELKKSADEATQTLQIQAWREDADKARLAQKAAEGRVLALEAENQKLRVDLAALKRDADEVSAQAYAELEKRFKDLTEVLYMKQTQLEAMASEKAAAVFQLEKELSRLREAQAEVEKHRKARHTIPGWDEESDMQTFESLGLQQRRPFGTSIQLNLQRAAKLLDSGSVTAGRFLWRRPLARLVVFFYLVFVHLFLLYLLHRLQEQVLDSITSKEKMEALLRRQG